MSLVENTDSVQIGIADLLTDLKVVVAVVDERLRILTQVKRAQPLNHNVASHRHVCRLRGLRGLYHAPAALFPCTRVSLRLPSDLVLLCPCPLLRALSRDYAPRHLRKNADRRLCENEVTYDIRY
ncbi:hypothetical protein WN48_11014 [Eufriesea mexicana]|uniref:Uncharacterized protein n=1 Tax=Eufriesea mexicana TaxID=516756 RepID=A0A310SHW3_9HYME|nr:hypothetical protein WN48_11014 [Eufriesea mexicana]